MSKYETHRRYTGKAEFEKAINSLLGLIEGIAIDSVINADEIEFLQDWLESHRIKSGRHPFNELFPVVEKALSDGFLSDDEREDITWLCQRLLSTDYFKAVTADMQKLHAVIAGIASDGEISVEELQGLSVWLQEHDSLKSLWPYDEIESLVTSVLKDKKIDDEEHKMLLGFFNEFITILDKNTLAQPVFYENSTVVGLCAVCPDIVFDDAVFCLTGASGKYSRAEFEDVIVNLGGSAVGGVSKKVNYLVIGSDGNPSWAYACYGRKVERAVELRKQGHPLVIIHENDFHDAVYDK